MNLIEAMTAAALQGLLANKEMNKANLHGSASSWIKSINKAAIEFNEATSKALDQNEKVNKMSAITRKSPAKRMGTFKAYELIEVADDELFANSVRRKFVWQGSVRVWCINPDDDDGLVPWVCARSVEEK